MKFIIICLALICIGCKKEAFQLHIDIPLEEVKVEVFHYASGDKLLDTMMSSLHGVLLEFPGLKEDMYTFCVSWERTLVPHQLFKRKNGKIELEFDNRYYVIKNLYINPREDKDMSILFKKPLSKEGLEGDTYYKENIIVKSSSADFELSEKFNRIYEQADSVLDLKNRMLRANLIEAIDNRDWEKATAINRSMSLDALEGEKVDQLTEKINLLAKENTSSPVTVCYLFMELLKHGNFKAYEKSFSLLNGKAATSPYYGMIKKRMPPINQID